MRSASARVFGIVLLALCTPLILAAQPSVADTIRWVSINAFPGLGNPESRAERGIVIARDSATLLIRHLKSGVTLLVPLADVSRAEVRRGSRRIGWRAIPIGTLTGAAIFGALGVAAGDSPHGEFYLTAGQKGVVGLVLGGLFGTVAGSVAALVRVENWVPMSP